MSDTEADEEDPIDAIRRRPFATLTPYNDAAIDNFDQLCDQVVCAQASSWSSETDAAARLHQAQFLHIEPSKAPRHTFISFSGSETDSANVDPAAASPLPSIWTGHYKLSLDSKPLDTAAGWVVGCGKSTQDSTTRQVDIRLWPSESKIHPSHARLCFNDAGVFSLCARHSGIAVNGHPIRKAARYALSDDDAISFGPATYRLRFPAQTVDQQAAWEAAIRTHVSVLYQTVAHPAVSATPTPRTPNFGEWQLKAISASNGRTTIKIAVCTADSLPAAFKVNSRQDARTADLARNELDIYRAITGKLAALDHPGKRYVRRLCDTFFLGGIEDWIPPKKDEVYMFFRPFANETIRQRLLRVDKEPWDLHAKCSVFAQLLLGLDALHTAGFIHRDIKPDNVMLEGRSQGSNSDRVTIIDLEQAVKTGPSLAPSPGSWGTIGFLAPEAENSDFAPTYGPKVDVFSAAIIGHVIFIGTPQWLHPRTNMFLHPKARLFASRSGLITVTKAEECLAAYQQDMEKFATRPAGTIEHLLHGMLAFDPARRMSIGDALQHPSLSAAVDSVRLMDVGVGQPRKTRDE